MSTNTISPAVNISIRRKTMIIIELVFDETVTDDEGRDDEGRA